MWLVYRGVEALEPVPFWSRVEGRAALGHPPWESFEPVNSDVDKELSSNYTPGWKNLGGYGGKQYGVYFKAANKSAVWYNTSAFQTAGVAQPPTTWSEFPSGTGARLWLFGSTLITAVSS